MKTLAVWYEAEEGHKKDKIRVEIHVNFFKLKNSKPKMSGKYDHMMELGFMIKDIEKITKMNIHFPFEVKKKDFTDVGSLLLDRRNLTNAIFNEQHEVTSNSSKQGFVKKINKEKGFTIYRIDFKNEETTDPKRGDYKLTEQYEGTLLSLNLKNIPKKGKSYIRFRLKLNKQQDFIKKSNPSNWFLQSAFTTTEALDFRINEKRSFHDSLAEEISKAQEFKISKIVFVLVREATDDLVLPFDSFSCREMENVWTSYFNDNSYDLKNMIIYQYSDNSKKGHFNSFIKIKVHRSTIWTISVFIIFLVIFSLFNNGLYNFFKGIFSRSGCL
jgi:hypothetical protein